MSVYFVMKASAVGLWEYTICYKSKDTALHIKAIMPFIWW